MDTVERVALLVDERVEASDGRSFFAERPDVQDPSEVPSSKRWTRAFARAGSSFLWPTSVPATIIS
jgi:hypothetical protein